jgi:hypothetical protein
MAINIQFRRGTASEWTAANPTLAVAEFGVETDTDKFKLGDGATAWTSLGYGGIQGPAGANGTSGVAAATSPVTYNSGTSTVGFDFSAVNISDINNVTISAPEEGQALTYDGSVWINSQPTASGETISSFLLMGA